MSNMPEAGENYRPSTSPNVALSLAERSRLQPRLCARRTRSWRMHCCRWRMRESKQSSTKIRYQTVMRVLVWGTGIFRFYPKKERFHVLPRRNIPLESRLLGFYAGRAIQPFAKRQDNIIIVPCWVKCQSTSPCQSASWNSLTAQWYIGLCTTSLLLYEWRWWTHSVLKF